MQRVGELAPRLRVSIGGGGQPVWRSDGRELFYVAPDNRLMAVDVETGEGKAGPMLGVGDPRPLFETRVDGYMAPNRYAVSADGQRFLMNVPAAPATTVRITVMRNWESALE